MGGSDYIRLEQQIQLLTVSLNYNYFKIDDIKDIKKIACLGNKDKNKTVLHYESIFCDASIELFDIELENWDINKSWDDIKGYDLVMCHGTTMYVENINNFILELKKCIRDNKNIIFDFSLFNPITAGSRSPPGAARYNFRNIFEFEFNNPYYTLNPFDEANTLTENDLIKHDIRPNFFGTLSSGSVKGDFITYMVWSKDKRGKQSLFHWEKIKDCLKSEKT